MNNRDKMSANSHDLGTLPTGSPARNHEFAVYGCVRLLATVVSQTRNGASGQYCSLCENTRNLGSGMAQAFATRCSAYLASAWTPNGMRTGSARFTCARIIAVI